MSGLAGSALSHDLACVLIERAGLRKQLFRLLQLRIFLKLDLITIVQTEHRGEYLALDLPFDPGQVVLNVWLGELDVLQVEIFAELSDHRVVGHEVLRYLRLLAQIVPHEIAYALWKRIKHATAEKRLLEIVQLRSGYCVVRRDSALSENLPATVGYFTFGARGRFGFVGIC